MSDYLDNLASRGFAGTSTILPRPATRFQAADERPMRDPELSEEWLETYVPPATTSSRASAARHAPTEQPGHSEPPTSPSSIAQPEQVLQPPAPVAPADAPTEQQGRSEPPIFPSSIMQPEQILQPPAPVAPADQESENAVVLLKTENGPAGVVRRDTHSPSFRPEQRHEPLVAPHVQANSLQAIPLPTRAAPQAIAGEPEGEQTHLGKLAETKLDASDTEDVGRRERPALLSRAQDGAGSQEHSVQESVQPYSPHSQEAHQVADNQHLDASQRIDAPQRSVGGEAQPVAASRQNGVPQPATSTALPPQRPGVAVVTTRRAAAEQPGLSTEPGATSTPTAGQQTEREAATPTIMVTIGRIEVRAAPSQTQAGATRRNTPALSLDEYMRQRDGGRS